jgi:hypothetical protein
VDKAFTVTINANGTISVVAFPSSPAINYGNYFNLLTNSLNAAMPVEGNPFNSRNLAPTTTDYPIHNIPTYVFPEEPANPLNTMHDAIGFATGATNNFARCLKPNTAERTKAMISQVIYITPDQSLLLKDSICLFSCTRKCEHMFSSSLTTQCRNCCKFGHPTQLCKQELPTCPICYGQHTRD